jgi:hypothetical protein
MLSQTLEVLLTDKIAQVGSINTNINQYGSDQTLAAGRELTASHTPIGTVNKSGTVNESGTVNKSVVTNPDLTASHENAMITIADMPNESLITSVGSIKRKAALGPIGSTEMEPVAKKPCPSTPASVNQLKWTRSHSY